LFGIVYAVLGLGLVYLALSGVAPGANSTFSFGELGRFPIPSQIGLGVLALVLLASAAASWLRPQRESRTLTLVAVNFGVMGLLGIPLDTVTSAISAMAVGIGADYAIYFLFRVREELARGDDLPAALERALMTSGKAVFFVSSAIAVGYATLCLSGFGLHVQLGSLVALAMVVSSASALVLLPAVIARFRPAFLWGAAAEEPAPVGETVALA